jgi:ribosomal protein S18 acetylase RimI-like enzyme
MAEDSAAQLNAYIDDGDVLVAQNAGEIVGHLQLIPRDPISGEIKNLAVLPAFRRRGVGSALVRQAIDIARHNGWNALVVRTATADTGNLRFYQRLGFRCVAIEPDAFTAASGYPANLMIDGIPLRDAIVLSQSLQGTGPLTA